MATSQDIVNAAQDIYPHVDKSTNRPVDANGDPTWPDSEAFTQAMRAANSEANTCYGDGDEDDYLDADERKAVCIMAVTWWMQSVAVDITGDEDLPYTKPE